MEPTQDTSEPAGFERIIKLRYDDDMESLAGLEVDLWPATVRQMTLMTQEKGENETADQINRRRIGLLTGDPDSDNPLDREGALVRWNVLRRGKPLPVDDLDGVLNYDMAVITRILSDWTGNCILPDPLDRKDKNSSGGSSTESSSEDEASIPTETLP